MRIFLLFICICFSTTSLSGLAWFLTYKFEPKGRDIFGIAINKIDPTWKEANVLSRDLIPKEVLATDQRDPMKEFNFRFVINKDINNDGKLEKIISGVYLAKKPGRFLLILTQDKEKWKKVFLHSAEGEAGFNILNESDDGTVFWTWCMECGMAGDIKWDGYKYRIEWVDENYG